MNHTLYQQLSPLGFAEWLEKTTNEYWILPDIAEGVDDTEIDDWQRTALNALAFRWLREEKKLLVIVSPVDDWTSWTFIIYAKDCMAPFFQAYPTPTSEIPEYNTHELAEHHALNKAFEILSKGGENGMD